MSLLNLLCGGRDCNCDDASFNLSLKVFLPLFLLSLSLAVLSLPRHVVDALLCKGLGTLRHD